MKNLVLMRMEQHFEKPKEENNNEKDNENNNNIIIENKDDKSSEFKLKAASEEIAQLKIALQLEKEKNGDLLAKIKEIEFNAEQKKSWKFWERNNN